MSIPDPRARARIERAIERSAAVVASLTEQADTLQAVCEATVSVLKAGNKILAAGNGGSAAEAMHLAEELTGRFRADRVPLPAIALNADSTALTCIGNDFGFEHVFGRQVQALGRPGDLLVLFSTSGNSPNLVQALGAARNQGMTTLCLLGRGGGALAGLSDLEIIVRSDDTERVQEAHQTVVHLILDAVEQAFANVKED